MPVFFVSRASVVAIPRPRTADARASAVGDWFSTHADTLVSGAIRIAILVVVAVLIRAVLGRLIDQMAKRIIGSHQRLHEAKTRARAKHSHGAVVEHSSSEEARSERQRQRASTIASVLKSVATFVIFGIAFVTVLGQFGIRIGPILTSAGVLGLAVGFGAQNLVKDFLSGIFMMVEDQYGVGDVIDVGDAVGTVEAVALRTTRIRDLNGGLWHVRNGEIQRVCNMSQDWANAVIELPLAYTVDLERAKQTIQGGIDAFARDPEFEQAILEAPYIAGVTGIGNGAVTVRVMVKTLPGQQWAAGRALRDALKQHLDTADVLIAQPVLPAEGAGAAQQG